MQQRRLLRALAIPLALTFVAAACGSDDDSSSDVTSAPDASDTESTPEDTSEEASEETTAPDAAEGDVDTTIERDDEAVRAYGGDVIYGLEAEATGLRPWEDACGEPCLNIHLALYDTITRQTADGEYQGFLAETVEPNEDFTVWTATLRPDIAFHDGTPLTAQTIVDMFAIQQTGSQSAGVIASSTLTGVEATGELEVTYTLSAGNSAFPAFLAGVLGRVFEPAAAAADPAAFNTNPIGTGPFVLASRDIDNETVVTRNPDWWLTTADGEPLPYLDSISFRPIPDENTRLSALTSGTVTMMQSLRQGTIRDARAQSGITLYEFQGNNTGGGMFNTAEVPFDDVRVRRGLNLMNDQQRVIDALGGTGISQPTTQWFSPDSPWYTEEAAAAWPTFDFEAGVALLQEYVADPARSDGKAPGEKIDVELSCPPDPTLIAAMQVIEQVWTGSNLVNVSLTQFDQATHINNAVNDAHKAHCWRWSSNQDPSIALNPFLAPPDVSVSNFPNFFNQESFDLAQQAIQTDDVDERKELYKEIMLNIAEDQHVWYSGYTATMVAVDPSIEGINGWLMPSGDLGEGFPNAVVSFYEVYIAE